MEAELRVRDFAVQAHGDQKYGNQPYVSHLDDVVDLVRDKFENQPDFELLLTVAYLHDVLEDTKVNYEEIRNLFGSLVADAVEIITDPSDEDRANRKNALHWRLEELEPTSIPGRAALIVKAADRLSNVRASLAASNEEMIALYVNEHWAFRKAAYRRGLCDSWWEELDTFFFNHRKA